MRVCLITEDCEADGSNLTNSTGCARMRVFRDARDIGEAEGRQLERQDLTVAPECTETVACGGS